MKTASIDLGISNYLAIDYEDGASELYSGNVLKEDKHYFTREEYQTKGENGPSKRARKARQKLSRRKDHFLHTLSKHIVEQCVKEGVGEIAVGDLSDIREDENGDSRNWGASGNKKLHGWEFDRFATLLEYKAEEHGILVDRVDEENTSETCSCCGQIRDGNRVERGLYVCSSCETTMNADMNGAVNISPSTVDTHLQRAKEKLTEAENLVQFVRVDSEELVDANPEFFDEDGVSDEANSSSDITPLS